MTAPSFIVRLRYALRVAYAGFIEAWVETQPHPEWDWPENTLETDFQRELRETTRRLGIQQSIRQITKTNSLADLLNKNKQQRSQ